MLQRRKCALTKCIDSGQPAQSAQADLGRNILLIVNFLHIEGTIPPEDSFDLKKMKVELVKLRLV